MVLNLFLNHVRKGEMGYYLPDEDFGAEQSIFVDFFGTYKATLPGLNKMANFLKPLLFQCFLVITLRLANMKWKFIPQ